MGHGSVFWQNVAHWRRHWQTTSVFVPWEPMSSMKRQKDRTLKDELPRSVGAQYTTRDQWRNNSRENEEMEPKQKQHPVMDVTSDRSKVWCCKEQYCIGTWNVIIISVPHIVYPGSWEQILQLHLYGQSTEIALNMLTFLITWLLTYLKIPWESFNIIKKTCKALMNSSYVFS